MIFSLFIPSFRGSTFDKDSESFISYWKGKLLYCGELFYSVYPSHRLARLSSGPFFLSNFINSGVNRPMDRRILNFFARISDSKRYFSGFPDNAIAADCGFIHFFGPGF